MQGGAKMAVETTNEAIDLLSAQHLLGEHLMEATQTIHKALEARDVEAFSRGLDRRQTLFVRMLNVQERIDLILPGWRDSKEIPVELAEWIKQNKELLGKVLKLDKTCQQIGNDFQSEVGISLGKTRTSKKIRQGYVPPSNKKRMVFIDGKA
jgi:hypothetical protein